MRFALWTSVALASLWLAPACSGRSSPGKSGGSEGEVIQCNKFVACGVDAPCHSGECLSVPGCGSAICVDGGELCQQACGSRDCMVLDSYPAQLTRCPDGTPIRGTGKGQSPTTPGTGGAANAGGSGMVGTGGSFTAGTPGMGTAGAPNGGSSMGGSGVGPGDVIDCTAFARCRGGEDPCAVQGFDCVAVPGCQQGICAPAIALCNTYCSGDCEVLASDPVELECSSETIIGSEGDSPGAGGAGGAGGSPHGWAGEPALAGASWGGEYAGGAP